MLIPAIRTVLNPASQVEWHRVSQILRRETIGGALLIVATILALVAANSPLTSLYHEIQHVQFGVGLGEWSFQMSLGHWASDGLLTIFFFLAGLELKREFVAGDLRHFDRALVPVAAAVGGVIVPAAIYLAMNPSGPAARGWAIPAATDIAFALAVLAVVGRNLPAALRTFLLTLAVVDDLIAIAIIAIGYTTEVQWNYLAWALVPLVIYGVLAQGERQTFRNNEVAAWLVLFPIGVICWALVYQSGIHATVSGVLLAFTVPVLNADGSPRHGLAESFEHRFRPLSAGFAVPVFAFFSAGVAFPTWTTLASPVAMGIVIGLVVGKAIGITGATFLVTRLRNANLDPSVTWGDIFGLSVLAGIGFTVSLLVSELAFGVDAEVAKGAVLVASVLAATLGGGLLARRGRANIG